MEGGTAAPGQIGGREPCSFNWYLDVFDNGVLAFQGQPFSFKFICELYVLAEMLMNDTTKDVIPRAILRRCKSLPYSQSVPEPSAIRTIYEGTPESSPARRLMVETFAQRGSQEAIQDWSTENLPMDILLDLSVSLIAQRPVPKIDNQVQTTSKWSDERDFSTTRKDDPPVDQSAQPKAQTGNKRAIDSNIVSEQTLKKKKKPRKSTSVWVVESDDDDDHLAFFADYSVIADAHSGNIKTKVTLGPRYDNTYTRAERIAAWQAKNDEEAY